MTMTTIEGIEVNIPAFKALLAHLKANISVIDKRLTMHVYTDNHSYVDEWHDRITALMADDEPRCNTTACIAGWAAASKHPLLVPVLDEVKWNVYVNRVFFNSPKNNVICGNNVYEFIFSGEWPNDINHGIKRIEYLIKHKEINVAECESYISDFNK